MTNINKSIISNYISGQLNAFYILKWIDIPFYFVIGKKEINIHGKEVDSCFMFGTVL